jgi:hypothetical protein
MKLSSIAFALLLSASASAVAAPDLTFFGIPLGDVVTRCVPMRNCIDGKFSYENPVGLVRTIAGKKLWYMKTYIKADKAPAWIGGGIVVKLYMFEDAKIQAIEFLLPWDSGSIDGKRLKLAYEMLVERLGAESSKHPIDKIRMTKATESFPFIVDWRMDWGLVRYSPVDAEQPSFAKTTIYIQSDELSQALIEERKDQAKKELEKNAARTNF